MAASGGSRKGKSGGMQSPTTPTSPTSLASLDWASPTYGGKKSELETVNVERVWQDFQKNGLTETDRQRVETQKRLIAEAQASGKPFRSPDLTFRRGEGFDVIDGRHRLTAFRELGFTQIRARVDR